MRSKLRKIVASRFKECFALKLPKFSAIKPAESASGAIIYETSVGNGLCFYVGIQFHVRRDSFTVEIAWSEKGRWPSRVLPASPVDKPKWGIKRAAPVDGEFRARLVRFWWDEKEDLWWDIRPKSAVADLDHLMDGMGGGKPAWKNEPDIDTQAEEDCALSLVDDAFSKIIEHAIPFFISVANAHGLIWPMSGRLVTAERTKGERTKGDAERTN